MSMFKDFKAFLFKQNFVSLAVAFVLGAAVGKVVSGFVDDLVMPLVGLLLPGGDWRTAELVLSGTAAIKYGDLLGRLLDFTIIAFVAFAVVRWLSRLEPKPAPTKVCTECLETIPATARRCRACGESQVDKRPLQPVGGS